MTGTPDAAMADLQSANAALRQQLAERDAENRALRTRQAASIEVLRAISASPDDPQPVFELIVRRARELCNAQAGNLVEFDGTLMHQRLLVGFDPEAAARLLALFPRPPGPDTMPGRSVLSRQIVHVPDAQADLGLIAQGRGLGARAFLNVPLLREGRVIGVLGLARFDPGEFDQSAIELVQSFAEQAVIAIAGAATLRELRERTAELAQRNTEYSERIDHQAATIDVLKAMSASPGDPQPVFELIVERARDLCGGYGSTVWEFDGTLIHWRAATGVSDEPAARAAVQAMYPMVPTRAVSGGRAILDGQIARIDDYDTDPNLHPSLRNLTVKSGVQVPFLRDGVVIGALGLGSRERGGFSDSQIELLKTFAEQAVIAITSAETYRALQNRTTELTARDADNRALIARQQASIEVLRAISTSPDDAQPVLNLIVRHARTLCNAQMGHFVEYDGALLHQRAVAGYERDPEALARFLTNFPRPPGPETVPGRVVLSGQPVHITDQQNESGIFQPGRALGARSYYAVPLLREARIIGVLVLGRYDPGDFDQSAIDLVQSFAEQAVIALNSAAALRELRQRTADLQESLQYQTATGDVLKVISRSTFDLQPVLDTVAETAARLCDAEQAAIFRIDGNLIRLGSNFGFPAEYEAHQKALGAFPNNPSAINVGHRAARERRVVHIHDVAAVPGYPDFAITLGKQRTALGVPLLREGEAVGVVVLARQRVEPFTERQIELVSTFADQAVIAIENTRLLTETREALEQQTATAEVLQVINASPGDLTPVFETMLDRAMRLCDAEFGELFTYDGERFIRNAGFGIPPALAEYRLHHPTSGVVTPGTTPWQILQGASVLHIPDLKAESAYTDGVPMRRAVVDLGGMRTCLAVALRKDNTVLGNISIYRKEVKLFSERQVALLRNFAEQAVIAIENARLIDEQREALEQQTATAEVLQVINASPGNLTPVFDTILEKARTLCGADLGTLMIYDGESFRSVALHGYPEELAAVMRRGGGPSERQARLVQGERFVHIPDLKALELGADDWHGFAHVSTSEVRTFLIVPLCKDGILKGLIGAHRCEVRPFSDSEIALLENFAAQAVIAMENARLINETREALEQQTATAEVLQVINASPGNLQPVFDAILEKAHNLCGIGAGSLELYDGEWFHAVAVRGMSDTFGEQLRHGYPAADSPATRPLLAGDRITHIVNAAEVDFPVFRAAAVLEQVGTVLFVPLRRDNRLLGMIASARRDVRPFSDKEITLLENFAAQAVIAMENARLINEQREALEQQTATAEALQVINASQGNIQPVFDAMLEKAMRLCDVSFGMFNIHDGASFRTVVTRGVPAAFAAFRASHPPAPSAGSPFGRAVETRRLVHVVDWLEEPVYKDGTPGGRAIADLGGARTVLNVPLVKEDAVLGVISFYRQEVRAFSNKQIALLENFAAQAVIAMESARLLNELRTRTDELAQRQAELRVTFENMGDGVAMFDEMPRLVAWNRKFQDILDLPDGMLDERPAFADYIRYLARRGEFGVDADPDAELRRVTDRSSEHYVLERTRPDGRVIEIRHNPVAGGGFVLIYADITERKRNEAEIAAARDAAQAAARTIEAAFRDLKTAQANLIQAEKMASLGQLTAGIAHEIKNPLNFVNNFAALSVELLAELKETAAPGFATLTDAQRADIDDASAMLTSNLQKITEHGKRADGIVRAMLEHSRGASGERRTVDINALVDEALNLAYHGARAQDQTFNIALERDFAGGIAPIELNPQDITRVFLNLFSNGFYAATKRARDNASAGFQPTLTVATRDLGDRVEIRVRDNGTGIPDDIRDKLFEPFFTTKPTGEGTGLGLSITYDIVTKQHGGTIAVESEVGDHTAFSIGLPRQMFAAEGAVA